MRIIDPRTGKLAYIQDDEAYTRELSEVSASCRHERRELRRFSNKNDTIAIAEQCMRCGERAGNAVKVAEREGVPAADESIKDVYWRAWKAARAALAIKHIDQSKARDAGF